MRQTFFISRFSLFAVLFLSSCSSDDMDENSIVSTGSENEMGLTVELETAYNNDINTFAFNLFRLMESECPDKSHVCSPVSAAMALAMLNDGASGITREEILQALGFRNGQTKAMNEYFQKLLTTSTKSKSGASLCQANAVFVAEGKKFSAPFVTDMTQYYQAETGTLDFTSSKAVDFINDWCARQTDGMIPHFLDILSEETRAFIVNATCFHGTWVNQFDPSSTTETDFICTDGSKTTVQMMCSSNLSLEYSETDFYQAVNLPYGDGSYVMTIILPKQGKSTANTLMANLTGEWWKKLCVKMVKSSRLVNVYLPKFSTNTPDNVQQLKSILEKMGAKHIFGQEAKIPNVLENDNLILSFVQQKAAINVTEIGTDAAAVTGEGLISDNFGDEEPSISFLANHPFIYVISDCRNGVVFFVGTFQGK